MASSRDLKSVVRTDLRVRLAPSAPLSTILLQLALFHVWISFAPTGGDEGLKFYPL